MLYPVPMYFVIKWNVFAYSHNKWWTTNWLTNDWFKIPFQAPLQPPSPTIKQNLLSLVCVSSVWGSVEQIQLPWHRRKSASLSALISTPPRSPGREVCQWCTVWLSQLCTTGNIWQHTNARRASVPSSSRRSAMKTTNNCCLVLSAALNHLIQLMSC